jgi:hypothetical protein
MRTFLIGKIFLPILFTIPLLVCIGGMRTPDLKKLLELRQHVHHVALFENKHKTCHKYQIAKCKEEHHLERCIPDVRPGTIPRPAISADTDGQHELSGPVTILSTRAPPRSGLS